MIYTMVVEVGIPTFQLLMKMCVTKVAKIDENT